MPISRRRLLIDALVRAPLALAVALPWRAGHARTAGGPRVIAIDARKFRYAPSLIQLRAGEEVVLEITAVDFPHGFSIPELALRVDLVPGKPVRLPLKAPPAGRYTFLCDNFCGGGHEEMNGVLAVAG